MGNCLFGFFAGSPVVWEQKGKKSRRPGGGCVKEFSVCLSRVGIPHHLPSFLSTLLWCDAWACGKRNSAGPAIFVVWLGKGAVEKRKKTCPCRKYCRKKGRHHHNPHIPPPSPYPPPPTTTTRKRATTEKREWTEEWRRAGEFWRENGEFWRANGGGRV